MYKYFVSYAFDQGFGSVEYRSPKPITSYEQVKEMSDKICQKINHTVTILNYILLDEAN